MFAATTGEVKSMKRFRWVAILFAGVALVVLGATSVFAGSSTYTANAIKASTFTSNGNLAQWHGYADAYGSGDWYWLEGGQYAKWTFDLGQLQPLVLAASNTTITGSVHLNFAALSTSPEGGSGYSTPIRIFATNGRIGGAATVTLGNPWQPHIGPFSAGLGWDSHASVPIPMNLWAKTQTLTVTVTLPTAGNWIAMNKDALVIGYATP